MSQMLLQKVELLSTFCNNFPQPATSWFVERQVWTRNIAIQLVLEQFCKTSCTFSLPVLSSVLDPALTSVTCFSHVHRLYFFPPLELGACFSPNPEYFLALAAVFFFTALKTLPGKGCLFFMFPEPCAAKHDVSLNEACMFCPADIKTLI